MVFDLRHVELAKQSESARYFLLPFLLVRSCRRLVALDRSPRVSSRTENQRYQGIQWGQKDRDRAIKNKKNKNKRHSRKSLPRQCSRNKKAYLSVRCKTRVQMLQAVFTEGTRKNLLSIVSCVWDRIPAPAPKLCDFADLSGPPFPRLCTMRIARGDDVM